MHSISIIKSNNQETRIYKEEEFTFQQTTRIYLYAIAFMLLGITTSSSFFHAMSTTEHPQIIDIFSLLFGIILIVVSYGVVNRFNRRRSCNIFVYIFDKKENKFWIENHHRLKGVQSKQVICSLEEIESIDLSEKLSAGKSLSRQINSFAILVKKSLGASILIYRKSLHSSKVMSGNENYNEALSKARDIVSSLQDFLAT